MQERKGIRRSREAVREMIKMRRREEWEEGRFIGGGEGEDASEVQKSTVMVPEQRERGKEEGTKGRRERKERGREIGGVLGLRIGL